MFALTALAASAGPDCFGFPDIEFSAHNRAHVCDPENITVGIIFVHLLTLRSHKPCLQCADSFLSVKTGQTAPDFTLNDRDGKSHGLYDLLDDGKPVFIEFGSFT